MFSAVESCRTKRGRKRGNTVLICSGCDGKAPKIEEVRQREVRDLPWRKFQAVVYVEYYRVPCSQCGLKVERVPQLPSKAPFSKDFEDAVGLACESAAARQVARQFRLAASTVRAIDQRYLERWSKSRKKPVLRQLGVDEIYLGKTRKFLTMVSNLETGEPLWFGSDRKEATLDASYGVCFISTSQSLDTDQANPTNRLLLQILASVVEFEREMIRERTFWNSSG